MTAWAVAEPKTQPPTLLGRGFTEIAYGECHCGCGGKTVIASRTRPSTGSIKGQPAKFILGHAARKTRPEIVQPDDPSIKYIPLTQGKFAIVDAADYDWLMQWKWHARREKGGKYYAERIICSKGGRTVIRMQNLLVNPREGYIVDHIHGDTLDNRRSQIREATYIQNAQNRGLISTRNKTGVIGVSLDRRRGIYVAGIRVNGVSIRLGGFKVLEDAARVRKEAEIKYFGQYRRKEATD